MKIQMTTNKVVIDEFSSKKIKNSEKIHQDILKAYSKKLIHSFIECITIIKPCE